MAAMLRRFLFLPIVLVFCGPGFAACPAEKARYVSVDDPGFTAGLVPKPPGGDWRSDLAFFIHSGHSKRTFWFLFDAGSGSYMNLISTLDPTRKGWRPPASDGPAGHPYHFGSTYLQADPGLHFRHDAPQAGQEAPAYILLPDLAEGMWYSLEPRESAPVGVFKLADCAE